MKINKNITFDYHLNEINTGSMLNTVLDDNNNICTKPFQCKDYIQDVYWAEKLKKNIEQYGLKYDGTNLNNVFGKETIKLLITDKSIKDYNNIVDNIIKALNTVETALDIPHTTFKAVVDDEEKNTGDVVLFFNEKWFSKPYMISLFMFIG